LFFPDKEDRRGLLRDRGQDDPGGQAVNSKALELWQRQANWQVTGLALFT
jgi:hypothetical protein